MRVHFFILALTFLVTPSVTAPSPTDVLYIQDLIAEYVINLDKKNFDAWDSAFLPNATYNTGEGFVQGLPNIKKELALIVGQNVTQTSLTTQSIKFGPGSGKQGASSKATATSYVQVTYIGQGVDRGKAFLVYAIATDQVVKTGDFSNYGGWKFSARDFKVLVSAVKSLANTWISAHQ